MLQTITVKFRNRTDGSLFEITKELPEKSGRVFRRGDFRYKGHEVL